MTHRPALGATRTNGSPSKPILKEPTWTWEIPMYFYAGGLAGASAGFAYLTGLRGADTVARRAWLTALAGVGVSPVLLISDLGRPGRFLNMLRMFKVTSPMSVGSWILVVSGGASTTAAALELLGRLRPLKWAAELVSVAAGPPLASRIQAPTFIGEVTLNTRSMWWKRSGRPRSETSSSGETASATAPT